MDIIVTVADFEGKRSVVVYEKMRQLLADLEFGPIRADEQLRVFRGATGNGHELREVAWHEVEEALADFADTPDHERDSDRWEE